jgi:hypothetical protein
LYLYAVGFLYLSLCFLIALGMDQDDGTADSENNPPSALPQVLGAAMLTTVHHLGVLNPHVC